MDNGRPHNNNHLNLYIEMEKKFRFKFSKTGEYKYFSHLDVISIITRAIRRAKIRLKYSEGFNPRPKISFGPPTPLGIESRAEYCDIIVVDEISEEDLALRLNDQLMKNIMINTVREAPTGTKNLMSQADLIEYSIYIRGMDPVSGSPGKLAEQVGGTAEFEGSIYDINSGGSVEDGEGSILKLSGYAKICKDRNSKVFKLMNFLECFKGILIPCGLIIEKVIKEELYILKERKKVTPFEILQFYV
ncbi:MAG: TIGR03936 family radical SAM-associated protein [Actinomycetia bacterium]|nr:TIGR03936 family radical SAM-associated protein [Actinomycetes bacterium]